MKTGLSMIMLVNKVSDSVQEKDLKVRPELLNPRCLIKKSGLPLFSSARFLPGFFVVLAVLFASVSQAEQWTRFRGPNGQGISAAQTIPVKWTQDDYNWKVKLPGGGHSSPVVWKDKIFVTTGHEQANCGTILALSVSEGQTLWQRQYTLGSYRMNRLNSYAATTPAVDADRVYVLWPASSNTMLVALDHFGNELWKRTFGPVRSAHGAGTSPVVFEDIVVFTHEQERGSKDIQSAWIAVDCRTGQTQWRLQREKSPKMSYSTPCIYQPAGHKPQLVFTSYAHGITGVNPRTAEVMWEVKSAFADRVVSSPVIAGELIIGTCGEGGSGRRLIAIQPGKADKVTEPKELYRIEGRSATYVPTPLAVEELLFTVHDQGYISCLSSATGEQRWRQKPAGRFYGSPIYAGGNLYCITITGDVVVTKAASSYDLLAVNPLGEKSHATPAIAGGRMYLRTYSHLISIGPKDEQAGQSASR
jgi:outer membrane protein assembly factor BamB